MSVTTTYRWIAIAPLILTLILMAGYRSQLHAQEAQSDAMVADFMNVYNTTTDKIAQLGDAFPMAKYDWRPAEGIRSVREALLHVASGNYFFGSMLGGGAPEGVDPQTLEQSEMNKTETVAALKKSVAYVQQALDGMSEEAFEEEIDLFGNTMTRRQVMFLLGDHAAEHLGQLIAYARSNGVVPPWSQGSN